MSTVILIRHARSSANAAGILAGQTPGVRLDPTGVEQSFRLAEILGAISIAKVFISPLERCLDTISPWISQHGKNAEIHSDSRIIEPDYGLWSGKNLDELRTQPLWDLVQNSPREVTFPSGESLLDVWERTKSFYSSLREFSDQEINVVVVSHGDIIKFLIAQIVDLEMNKFQNLVIEPASVSIARFEKDSSRLIQSNRTDISIASILEATTVKTIGGEVSTTKVSEHA